MLKETEQKRAKVSSRSVLLIFIDLALLFLSFAFTTVFRDVPFNIYWSKYYVALLSFSLYWIIVSALFEKYSLTGINFTPLARRIILSNIVSFALLSLVLLFFRFIDFSRVIVFGTILTVTILELFVFGMWFVIKQSHEIKEEMKGAASTAPRPEFELIVEGDNKISPSRYKSIKKAIREEVGDDVLNAIKGFVDISLESTLVVSTTTRFNIDSQPSGIFKSIVNIKRINDYRWINKFFESVNSKIPKGGLFICIAETKEQRKERIIKKFPPVLNYIYYTFDYIVKRIFPKFSLTKGIYFFLTRGQNRVISRAEVLGRLFSCGFDIVDELYVGNQFFIVSKKIKRPAYDMDATYGPLIKLKRIGKGGALIRVYKMRTMHPYAEYLQDYVYRKHSLDEGGKFKNDFRVSTAGRIMRRLWIDELPMIINMVRGDLKIVGVRPLSQHYYSLYSKELQELRIKFKPGLIPPFYVDNPKTLDEIMASEMKYLKSYEKSPFLTDIRYFFLAVYNIIFKRYRSS
jgi:lipopolysaccharide/colanic/teichoic acid biosynthesis glycosyltransferase